VLVCVGVLLMRCVVDEVCWCVGVLVVGVMCVGHVLHEHFHAYFVFVC